MHKLDYLLLATFLLIAGLVMAQPSAQKNPLLGVAYYDEYTHSKAAFRVGT